MVKTIIIDGKAVAFKATAAVPRLYRIKFKRDIIQDLNDLKGKYIKVVNGEIKAYPAMGLSLTFDHRAVDGAPAAKFLKEVCDGLENFMTFVALN